jgi:hypothetical protein
MRPLSRNTSSTSSVSVSVADVVAIMTGYCHIDSILSNVPTPAGGLADARTRAAQGSRDIRLELVRKRLLVASLLRRDPRRSCRAATGRHSST